jgi:CTP:molybdopterin cytidylyltransferase MocA
VSLAGLVLAAGAGTRFGGPKALARTADGQPWVARVAETLRTAGAGPVVVALGAGRETARGLVPQWAVVVEVDDWAQGLSASVRAGLDALGRWAGGVAPGAPGTVPDAVPDALPDAVVVAPVDVPSMPVEAVRRLVLGAGPRALRQATYRHRPGHPVVIGRSHWDALARGLRADVGARPYLVAHAALEIPCDDLWDGQDVDTR